ncbi:MAG TPA: hypothetical protein VFY58_01170 [Nocardioides sp.]|nr:hypothetical protein [Nocardioides sp.]
MSLQVIVYILTALAVVVVVLTRLRLRESRGAGAVHVGEGFLNLHTVAGSAAVVVWLLYLVADDETPAGNEVVGIIALALWWITVVAGLLILVRWLPSSGKHASAGTEDTWSEGPGLSILAHVGMLVGVCVFTYAYLTAKV